MGKSENRYDIPLATTEQINKIIKRLNRNEITGPDKVPPKIMILSAISNFIRLSFSRYH